jgi:hypothetical protein
MWYAYGRGIESEGCGEVTMGRAFEKVSQQGGGGWMRRQDSLVYVPGEPPYLRSCRAYCSAERRSLSVSLHTPQLRSRQLWIVHASGAGSESQQVTPCMELALCTGIDA